MHKFPLFCQLAEAAEVFYSPRRSMTELGLSVHPALPTRGFDVILAGQAGTLGSSGLILTGDYKGESIDAQAWAALRRRRRHPHGAIT